MWKDYDNNNLLQETHFLLMSLALAMNHYSDTVHLQPD